MRRYRVEREENDEGERAGDEATGCPIRRRASRRQSSATPPSRDTPLSFRDYHHFVGEARVRIWLDVTRDLSLLYRDLIIYSI